MFVLGSDMGLGCNQLLMDMPLLPVDVIALAWIGSFVGVAVGEGGEGGVSPCWISPSPEQSMGVMRG